MGEVVQYHKQMTESTRRNPDQPHNGHTPAGACHARAFLGAAMHTMHSSSSSSSSARELADAEALMLEGACRPQN